MQSTRERIYLEKDLPKVSWVGQSAGNSFEFVFNDHVSPRIPRRYRYFMILDGGISINFGTDSHNESVHFFFSPQSGSSFMQQCNNGNCYYSCWGNEMTEYLLFPPSVKFKSIDLDASEPLKVDFWVNSFYDLPNVKMKFRITILVSVTPFDFSDLIVPSITPGPDYVDGVDDD